MADRNQSHSIMLLIHWSILEHFFALEEAPWPFC